MATLNKQKRDTEFKPYHVQFAEQVISRLEQGTAPWQKPWKGGELFAPHNEANGNQYKGLNRILLSYFSDIKYGGDPRYMTLLQANNQGYRVRKGEHGQSVVHWQFTEERPALDASGKPVLGEDGKARKEIFHLERPRVKYARVFNATQLERAEDGAPYPAFEPSRAPRFSWEPNEKAAAILAASGAVIEHRPGDRACYLPAQDTIVLPEREQFPDAAGYYGTALHELGHWTGHESRLNRDIRHPFGSAEYAREELRAEIASWMMGQDLGVAYDPGRHAAYVADWIRTLEQDPYEIVRAAGDAEKVKEYVMGLEQTQKQAQDKEKSTRKELVEQYSALLREGKAEILPSVMESQARELGMLDSFHLLRQLAAQQAKLVEISKETADFDEERDIVNTHIFALTQALQNGVPLPSYMNNIDKKNITIEELAFDFEKFVDDLKDYKEIALVYEEILNLWDNNKDSILVNSYIKTIIRELGVKYDCGEEPNVIYGLHHQYDILNKKMQKEKDKDKLYSIKQEIYINRAEFDIIVNSPENYFIVWAELGMDNYKNSKIILDGYSQFLSPQSKENLENNFSLMPSEPIPVPSQGTDKNLPEQKTPRRLNGAMRHPRPAMSPQEEFAQALKDAGLDLRGELPEMDGKLHRVPLADRPHGRDGAYVGYLDGRPAGYIQNFLTGEKTNWKASGHRLSEAQIAELRAEADQRRQERENERQAEQNRVAAQCAEIFEQRPLAAGNHPYLMQKDVLPHGIRESPDGSKLIVPLRNIQGDIRSVQIINEDGSKFFEKGGQKHGCFHLLGGEEKLKKQGQVLLAEGYATAASLYEATGRPVAACFDAGNLEPVAKAFREKYPHLPITVCADNDVRNEVNVGMAKAERAAKAVNGRVAIPRFTLDEEAQGMTDFNDLRRLHGDKAVKEAVLQTRHQTKGMER